jgi:metal-responsive CopG/Arc/MetJ family transcriptional regulator
MPSKVKVTVSLDSDLIRELSQAGRQSGKSRSRLMEEALEHWRRSRLAQELKKGYLVMAKEDLGSAKAALAAQREAVD